MNKAYNLNKHHNCFALYRTTIFFESNIYEMNYTAYATKICNSSTWSLIPTI